MTGSLSALWSARSVAVVGASDRPGSVGRLPVEFLQRYGFSGDVYPVRPDGASVGGLLSYASVADCPGSVDLALLLVSAERVGPAIDDCANAGVPVAIVCSSGFAETGAAGAALQADVVARARAGGLRVLGPNTIGALGVRSGLVASFSPLFSGRDTKLVEGGVAFVTQSGALGYGAVSLAFERGLGLGWVVNTGNEADVTAVEVMLELAALDECTAVLGYVESLTDMDGLRALADIGKPVALLKAGRSEAGQRAAASHTGALASTDRVVDAALRQLGIVRADDVEELLDVGEAFAATSVPRTPTAAAPISSAPARDREGLRRKKWRDRPHDHGGGGGPGEAGRCGGARVAVVTTSGGSGILAADAIERYGLVLARLSEDTRAALEQIVPAYGATANPVDVTASVMSDAALFDRALAAIAQDENVDLVVACFCVLTGSDVDTVVAALSKAARSSGLPVLVARTGAEHLAPNATAALRAEGIPAYPTPARAVRSAAALWQVAQARDGSSSKQPSPVPDPASPPGDESGLKKLLAARGFPVPRGRVVSDRDDATRAVSEVGGRAAFKAVVPGLTHKTEAGGVLLGITTENAAAAYDEMAALGGGVLVEEMVSGGVEALVGVAPSPLGPVLTLGPGGVLAEVLDDVALRVLPVAADALADMLGETRLGQLLTGPRGAPAADAEALVDLLGRVQQLVLTWPPVELDLNPVTVLPAGQGVRVLDAALVVPHQEHLPTADEEG